MSRAGGDFPDPRTVPSMLEAGVSGVPRDRAWDIVVALELPSLADSPLTRVSFYVLERQQVEVVGFDGADSIPDATVALLAEEAARNIDGPLEARALRTTETLWSLAMRRSSRRLAEIDLPAGVETVSVAQAPDGELTAHVNGELTVDPDEVAHAAITDLAELARAEHAAFVATVERFPSGRVSFSVEPL